MRGHAAHLVAIVTLGAILAAGCMSPSATPQNLSGATPIVTQSPVCRSATSAEEMVAFVQKAYEFANVEGKEAALAEFNNMSGRFVDGELYIFAYDTQGTTLALPFQPQLVGTNR